MANFRSGKTILESMVILSIFFLLTTGCSGLKSKKGGFFSNNKVSKKQESAPLYYDFDDVLIPKELKVDKKSSYIVQSPGFQTGVLALKGRVERNSLIAFFENNMAKDNWMMISSFKSPQTSTMLLFHKANRWCVISIDEKGLYTYVQIGVAPAMDSSESGLMK